jgi:hypothetical protein
MKNNNDSIELQSNSKRACVEVDCRSLLKKKKLITILMIETKSEEHIYKNGHCQPVNHDFLKTKFKKIWRRFD